LNKAWENTVRTTPIIKKITGFSSQSSALFVLEFLFVFIKKSLLCGFADFKKKISINQSIMDIAELLMLKVKVLVPELTYFLCICKSIFLLKNDCVVRVSAFIFKLY
jgi:hypothetical protein